ncbi:hypothetical protein HRI_002659900 [Hibiscus trionum]|uniref:RNase H type-1 domain-containing protein n=1 Tax=Hibiscus trionum TaxID=183268 RepID=A0A9W7I7D8_HIBTR|nr:hypothetical protein HRI_002659900 [Hibiscus trionum]
MVRKSPIAQGWTKPPSGFICVNVDGSIRAPSGLGLIGGVFRDDSGSWLLGFQQTMGIATAFTTELWAIWTGLFLAWENGFEKVQVQSDCRTAVDMVMDGHAPSSPTPLVRAIAAWRERSWFTEVIWVPRERNITTDKLSKSQNCSNRDLTVLDQPPSFLFSCLHRDRTGAVPPS